MLQHKLVYVKVQIYILKYSTNYMVACNVVCAVLCIFLQSLKMLQKIILNFVVANNFRTCICDVNCTT